MAHIIAFGEDHGDQAVHSSGASQRYSTPYKLTLPIMLPSGENADLLKIDPLPSKTTTFSREFMSQISMAFLPPPPTIARWPSGEKPTECPSWVREDPLSASVSTSRNSTSCSHDNPNVAPSCENVRSFKSWQVKRRRDGVLKTVLFEHHGQPVSVSAKEILFALGRVPNTGPLDLDKAGVATERRRIVANEFMRTNAPHIYTAGDCTGPHDIVHLAVLQGEIAAHNIAHPNAPRRMDDRLLLAVMFTEPQVAFVGLTEKAATARGVPYLTARYLFRDLGKALIMEARDGFVKLLADPQSGEILGGACVGPVGGELIHEIVTALAKRMTVHELAALPHYHPTLAEIWTYPAEALAE